MDFLPNKFLSIEWLINKVKSNHWLIGLYSMKQLKVENLLLCKSNLRKAWTGYLLAHKFPMPR